MTTAQQDLADLIPGGGNPNISLHLRPKCAQLFFVYSGMGGFPGMGGVRFLKDSGLVDRNLALIRDPSRADFMNGIGGGIDDLESLVDWHEACRKRLTHVSEIYCVGNSMGGYAAVLFAHLLGAKTAWVFGLRPRGGIERVRALRDLLTGDDGTTEYRLYFSPRNDGDRQSAEVLDGCPGVVLCPQERVKESETHAVLLALADSGELARLFPPFKASDADATTGP